VVSGGRDRVVDWNVLADRRVTAGPQSRPAACRRLEATATAVAEAAAGEEEDDEDDEENGQHVVVLSTDRCP
jgi:hypothetical protein